jgi:glycosyltransferase involved in cell wall biosynthesis
LLAYKRVDLAVAACRRLDRDLVVIGDGPERRRLQEIAGPRTRFLGHVDRQHYRRLIAGCRAFIAPGIEDFGIAPVEAMAAGKPVVAFAAGGALETIVDGETGVFFHEPTGGSIAAALERLDSARFDPLVARERAMNFDASAFRSSWHKLLVGLGLGLEDLLVAASPAPSQSLASVNS